MSPDIGGVKRAQRLRECLVRTLAREVDFVFMEKRRATGVVSGGTLVGDVDGRVEIIRTEPMPAAATLPEQLREAPQASRHPATI
jgi:ribose-phosphate pyrophosphokinase